MSGTYTNATIDLEIDMHPVDKKIKELEAQLLKAKAEKEALSKMTEEQILADQLHTLACRWNHTDGCSWYYEYDRGTVGRWEGWTHKRWLSMAKKLRGNKYRSEDVIDIIKIVFKSSFDEKTNETVVTET
jgi:sarcosine oxidase delta subunit